MAMRSVLAAGRGLGRSAVVARRAASTGRTASTTNTWASLAFMGGAGVAVAYLLSQQTITVASSDSALEKRVAQIEVELSNNRNRAFVFVKPHAVNDKVVDVVKQKLAEAGISITSEGALEANVIDEKMLIDNHYGAIASKAVKLQPKELNVPSSGQEKFQKAFGESWTDVIGKGKVYNAAGACQKLGITGSDLDKKWAGLKRDVNLIKFGGGFYCGQVEKDVYVINGFYMSMREAYVRPGSSIHYFTVEWNPDTLSWADFRGKVLGATDPKTADKSSVRRHIFDNWRALGLSSEPNVGDNGVHASASPFEAMAERVNWVGATISEDGFGKAMLASGIPAPMANEWRDDPQVKFAGGKSSLFDLLEDLDARECLAKSVEIAAQQ
ncbi:uncharacterized protein MONBRDRAFT_33649 [Monosiga brevicollis MX1]|uniref:Nucleoside-diphosphate kinase n=1 Tax=Monosiga brevicollis TaxID=81824 RepID=A9V6T2_MONBE|nr:uncharacterized protein MONBRDRAFT_33649 [Monosiga brevicollis MX1]EDQ86861.1 predicted protein [Monosiga brevicollis MX1]|eukprot:XP_001748406.1 hypothetical protein [Monosiga brevicollis MX1]